MDADEPRKGHVIRRHTTRMHLISREPGLKCSGNPILRIRAPSLMKGKLLPRHEQGTGFDM